ncbi:MAG: hypothetical protein OXC14_02510 [Rhodospirillaceae bacterium]|nr:hypothetical protein [Rhodospirillaceae bacterium]
MPDNLSRPQTACRSAMGGEVCERIQGLIERQSGWRALGVSESPIRGPEGNREFLVAAKFDGNADRGGSNPT